MDFAKDFGPLPPDDMRRLMESADRYKQLEESALVRVIGVGRAIDAGAVRFELIALELRSAGAIVYWKAYTREPVFLGQAVVTMTDESGTTFEVFPASGGGGENLWIGQSNVTPRPRDGTTVRIEFGGFDEIDRLPQFKALPPAIANAHAVFQVAI
jgi:hypothetical protein